MYVRKVNTSDTGILRQIISIHDEMPRAWDPSHRVAPEHLATMLGEIQSTSEIQGIWTLTNSEHDADDLILGVLWAKLKKSLGNEVVCGINSFWIHPEFREKGFATLLTDSCLLWARENGAIRLECSTHIENLRMKDILEKKGFKPGMVQYSLPLHLKSY
jgi:RimJ/RimL family protein N-acetyltransferase